MGKRNMPPLNGYKNIALAKAADKAVVRLFQPEDAFTPQAAAVLLAKVDAVARTHHAPMVLTAGGFVTVIAQRDGNLAALTAIANQSLTGILPLLPPNRPYDLCIGIDILRPLGRTPAQFAAFVPSNAGPNTIVWKSYPVGEEARGLPGFGTPQGFLSPRHIAATHLGSVGVMVCHDVQAFNHRNQTNVGNATPRRLVITNMTMAFTRAKPRSVLNLVHWIEKLGNTRTFHTSYRTLHGDHPWRPISYGAFGYGQGIRNGQLSAAIAGMKWPASLPTTDVIIS
ncbi:MAG: hypothetical protein HY680_09430 [Chloroflexi bacterium]|nr:hypothetical protein [Chloroflexota bacterium]